MAASIGKVFEKEVQLVMKLLFEQRLVSYHRLADTGAAGSLIAEQPSDYLLGLPAGCSNLLGDQRLCFLEVKASEKNITMPKDAVRPSQRGAIARFRFLLEIPYYILFWDAQNGVIQLWDGIAVHDTVRIDKRYLLATWPNVGVINKLQRQRVADLLADYFQIPCKGDTLHKSR
ncbi:Holliday junction resolvase [Pseudomonas phage Lana]|uniref:Uncharacterized protein n=1 Tax=Pseudomonas phage Lana TaxID=2530172 RepID=A0A481W624_9CAUD|nr:Holliday junction resolvase [Pseudomonas phage Lana]QBJ04536.1 hypothetical protein [Pseudomonas phage Lana]